MFCDQKLSFCVHRIIYSTCFSVYPSIRRSLFISAAHLSGLPFIFHAGLFFWINSTSRLTISTSTGSNLMTLGVCSGVGVVLLILSTDTVLLGLTFLLLGFSVSVKVGLTFSLILGLTILLNLFFIFITRIMIP